MASHDEWMAHGEPWRVPTSEAPGFYSARGTALQVHHLSCTACSTASHPRDHSRQCGGSAETPGGAPAKTHCKWGEGTPHLLLSSTGNDGLEIHLPPVCNLPSPSQLSPGWSSWHRGGGERQECLIWCTTGSGPSPPVIASKQKHWVTERYLAFLLRHRGHEFVQITQRSFVQTPC